MDKIKYLVFNDPHLSNTAPSSRRLDDYEDACFDKLDQIRDIAVDNGCHTLLCTGDWFHRKNPAMVPYALVNRLWNWLTSLELVDVRLATIAGNHDVRFSDTTHGSLDKQPFGVIARHPSVSVVHPNNVVHIYSTVGNKPPTQRGLFRDHVVLTGHHFVAPEYDADGRPVESVKQFDTGTKSLVGTTNFHIHLCHANVVPTEPIWKPYTLVDDVFRATEANIVHCGHIHDDVGIFKGKNKAGEDAYFTNIGSITRGALNEETINRVPQVLLVEIDLLSGSVQMQRITLAHKPHAEIYDLNAYETRREKRVHVREWSAKVRNELFKTVRQQEETVEEVISRSDLLDHPARELAIGILHDSE